MLLFTENEWPMILKIIFLKQSKGELLYLEIANKIIYFCLFVSTYLRLDSVLTLPEQRTSIHKILKDTGKYKLINREYNRFSSCTW